MDFFRQLKILKWSFIVILFCNIFFITSGVTFVVFYHKSNQRAVNLNQNILSENLKIINTLDLLDSNSSHKEIWKNILKLEESSEKPSHFQWSEKILKTGLSNFTAKSKLSLKSDLNQWMRSNYERVTKSYQSLEQLKSLFIFSLIFSALFGIVLPLVIISLILRKLYLAQKSFISWCREAIQQWRKQFAKENSERFKDPEFWLKALFLSIKSATTFSKQPFYVFVNDFASTIVEELNKPLSDTQGENEQN